MCDEEQNIPNYKTIKMCFDKKKYTPAFPNI